MELTPNKPHDLTFESEIVGVDLSQLKGFLRFLVDGIEYGIPVSIHRKSIKVSIPALESFIKKSFKSKTEIMARLEIVGPDFYLNAWEEPITIKPQVRARVAPVSIQSQGKVVVKGLKTPLSVDEQIEKAGFTDPRVKELLKRKLQKEK